MKAAVSCAISACACITLLVATFIYLPGGSPSGTEVSSVRYGSLLLNTSFIGYILIGAFAFLLGVCVALLCLYIRRLRKKENDRP